MTSQEQRAREVLAEHLNAVQAHALSGEYGQYVQITPAQALAAMLALAAEVREDAAKKMRPGWFVSRTNYTHAVAAIRAQGG